MSATRTPVLVVEDDDNLRALIALWLQADRWPVVEAETADGAIAAQQASGASIVICDINLKGPSGGLWLTRQLLHRAPGIAVIFATGLDELPGLDILQHGVTGYLVKPYNRAQLQEQLALAVAFLESPPAADEHGIDDGAIDALDRLLDTDAP